MSALVEEKNDLKLSKFRPSRKKTGGTGGTGDTDKTGETGKTGKTDKKDQTGKRRKRVKAGKPDEDTRNKGEREGDESAVLDQNLSTISSQASTTPACITAQELADDPARKARLKQVVEELELMLEFFDATFKNIRPKIKALETT
jgi:hypothetical protein